LNEEDFLAWTASRPGEATSSTARRASLFNDFASFLSSSGHDAYVAADFRFSYDSDFTPYIYTDRDMVAIFHAVDNLPKRRRSAYDHEAMMPVLVRLFYSTGIRHSEATGLRLCDVDLSKPSITVVLSKNRKDRLVMLSRSMAAVLERYLEKRPPRNPESLVFGGKEDRRISPGTLLRWHHDILRAAGVRRPDGNYPRIHDYRHGFIIRSLEQMEDFGIDTYAALPLLSCYVGHCSIRETEYYIRLTDEGRRRIIGCIEAYAPGIVPNIGHGEDDEDGC
jgi:integrase